MENEPEQALEEVSTPGTKTIAALAAFLNVPESQTLKAVFYMSDGDPVFVTIRGDLDVNEVKLKNVLNSRDLRLAEDHEVKAAGLVAGSASAVGISGIKRVADVSITYGSKLVVGANKPDVHDGRQAVYRAFHPVCLQSTSRHYVAGHVGGHRTILLLRVIYLAATHQTSKFV